MTIPLFQPPIKYARQPFLSRPKNAEEAVKNGRFFSGAAVTNQIYITFITIVPANALRL